jgi:hypothetical protein
VLRGTAKSRAAGIFLMGEAAQPGNTYARKLRKLRDRKLVSGQLALEAALRKLKAAEATVSVSRGGVKTSSD